jgi:hypothetical protein
VPKRSTLYDRTIERLKNNKVIVAILICVLILTGLLKLVGQVHSLLAFKWRHADSAGAHDSAVEFSRVVLSPGEHWEAIPRDAANYYYDMYMTNAKAEGDQKAQEELARDKEQGLYDCPDLFANRVWCRKCAGFFSQKGLQNIAIDPKFDILVTNKKKEPVVLHSIGVEVSYAEMVTVSLGDWETIRVRVDGLYEIPMPAAPTTVIVDKKAVDISAELKEMGETTDTVSPSALRALVQSTHYEWSNVPLVVSAPPKDPIYLPAGAPYRFEVVLKNYRRMPNNVVLRFVVHTNYGDTMSNYFYLLAL